MTRSPAGRRRRRCAAGLGAGAVGLALALAGCGGLHASSFGGAAPVSGGSLKLLAQVPLSAGARAELPASSWVVSFDAHLPRGSRLAIGLGYAAAPMTVAGTGAGLRVTQAHGRSDTLARPSGWLGRGWWHFEATNASLSIDGRTLPVRPSTASSITFSRVGGTPEVQALIATAAGDRGLLLLHRLAELHARIPARQFPIGATVGDRIVYGPTYWTSGFWAGALWQAAAIAPADGLFARWALAATLQHLGQERADTHDVGFEYGESSLAAWLALCNGSPAADGATAPPPATCARLRRSVLIAADELLALAASNPGSGTIPTNAVSAQADTIVDSMMNIAILPWATGVTGDRAYARLAAHQAQAIERLLVRPDGSTAQAVNFNRRTGRVQSIGTHQGLSNTSTWSRGEGWALYGFTQAAVDLRDRGLLRVAVRVANYVAAHLPTGAIPLWDYDAPAGAPVDVSAGVITAAGMFHLASACRTLAGVCASAGPARWIALGRRMLAAALGRARKQPPLGLLGSQALNERGRGCWCNGGELIFGLTYGLEALQLQGLAGG